MKTCRENPINLLGCDPEKDKKKLAVGVKIWTKLFCRSTGRPTANGQNSTIGVGDRPLGQPSYPTREPSSLTVDRSVVPQPRLSVSQSVD